MRGLLDGYGSTVGTLRLVARGIHPAVATPLQVGTRDVATPESRFDLSQQLLPYLLLLLAFIGGMQLAIDATAGERERQSLEPLLATPVSRESIISAKILATAVFALLSIAVTLRRLPRGVRAGAGGRHGRVVRRRARRRWLQLFADHPADRAARRDAC